MQYISVAVLSARRAKTLCITTLFPFCFARQNSTVWIQGVTSVTVF